MDRRLILAALAAGIATPVLAQTAATTSAAGSNAASSALGQPEMDYAMRTAMAGHASLLQADEGLQKARAPRVKEFAQFEHDEQTTIAEILKSMNPSMTMPAPDAKAAAAIAKLKEMKAGADFDRAFVTAQTEGHEMLLSIQEDYLKSGKNREVLNVAKLARGQIKEHLALLHDMRSTA